MPTPLLPTANQITQQIALAEPALVPEMIASARTEFAGTPLESELTEPIKIIEHLLETGTIAKFQIANNLAAKGDFKRAAALLAEAEVGYRQMGNHDLTLMVKTLGLSYTAYAEIMSGNLEAGLQLMAQAKTQMQESGNPDLFAVQQLQEPDLLAAGALRASQQMDFDRARVLFEQASQAAAQAAGQFEPGSGYWHLYSALERIYKGQSQFNESVNAAQIWNFSGLAEGTSDDEYFKAACTYLDKASQTMPIQQKLRYLAAYYPEATSILRKWGALVGSEPLTRDERTAQVRALVKRLDAAKQNLAGGGEELLIQGKLVDMLRAGLLNYESVMEGVFERSSRPRPRTGHTSLFVMIPFSADYLPLEKALRNLFETDPYNFEIVVARDRQEDKSLFENVCKLMSMADGFIGDITDHNPSVMMEVGMAEVDLQKRPFLLLRRTDGKDTPTDLRGRLRVEYSTPLPGADPIESLVKTFATEVGKIVAFQDLRRNRRVRFLSEAQLLKVAQADDLLLKDDRVSALRERYATVEEILARDASQIARETGLKDDLAAKLIQAFRKNEPAASAATSA